MKQIVHVKNLHLGHVAKSFAMREDPTSIGKANMKGTCQCSVLVVVHVVHRSKMKVDCAHACLRGGKKERRGVDRS